MDTAHDNRQESAAAAQSAQPAPTPRAAALQDLVDRTLAAMGYELVELERAGGGLLRVTMDCAPGADGSAGEGPDGADERHVGIEDCERVSRHLTHLFAVEDVDYDRLEVSSPGIDRPLRGARDFARFVGEMAKVQVFSVAQGRRRLRGQILAVLPAFAEQGVAEGGGSSPAFAERGVAGGGAGSASAGGTGPGPGSGSGSGPRVRMLLLPEAPPPVPKGARRPRARKAVPGETIEFALADVEKARLAPEWEFDRNAIPRTAPHDSD